MKIEVRNVTKRFGTFAALANVDLEVRSGELLALLGPSGSGKTTLLRLIAGLDWPDEGEIRFNDEDALLHSVRERNVGFVFQHYALFRHMSVFDNVAFGLRVRPRKQQVSEQEVRKRVQRLLDLVQIGWLADRYPEQLSGGQRQRVALARALAIEPKVLLLDEPFGALDAKVRKDLRRWLRHLHSELHVTSLLVTHDQDEALEVADRVVVMDKGRIEQVGTPQEIYERPRTAFVHAFIGEAIIVPVAVKTQDVHFDGQPIGLGAVDLKDGAAELFMRPYDVAIVPSEDAGLQGVVRRVHGLGPARRVEVALGRAESETIVEIEAPRSQPLSVGQVVGLRPQQYRIFPASNE